MQVLIPLSKDDIITKFSPISEEKQQEVKQIYTRYNQLYDTMYAHDNKLNFILGIENVILHSVQKEFVVEEWKKHFSHCEDDNYVYFLRPYLKEFLQALFTNFRVGIWSNSDKERTSWIVHHIVCQLGTVDGKKPEICFVYCQDEYVDCYKTSIFAHKEIKYVTRKYPQFRLFRTRIIDVIPGVQQTNDHWCVPLQQFFVYLNMKQGANKERYHSPFVGNKASVKDDALLKLIPWLLELSHK